ncbi:MAG: zinc metallopeptidase [Lachnospiraceae bacterium]|nr:zinc metallopeptidase [Lachnospiraceae bacterium]
MYYYPLFYDRTYILVLIGVIFTMIVQTYMTSTFAKYEKVESKSGLTASEACKIILNSNGINNVAIGHVAGNLTDHYAPTKKELNLSDTTYNSRSIASIGVAAHEAGHAIQDYKNMFLLNFQMAVIPVVNFASQLSIPVIIIGIILGAFNLVKIGIILFSATLFYQLITLPIEFNASDNAIKTLRANGLMDEAELDGVKKVLTAAAFTYVAAAASTVLQLLRFVILAKGSSRRN